MKDLLDELSYWQQEKDKAEKHIKDVKETFDSLKEVCIKFNISKPLLVGVLKGKYKQAKGNTFKYLKEVAC